MDTRIFEFRIDVFQSMVLVETATVNVPRDSMITDAHRNRVGDNQVAATVVTDPILQNQGRNIEKGPPTIVMNDGIDATIDEGNTLVTLNG